MQTKAAIVLLAAALLLQVAAAQQQGPVITWLKNNKDTTTAAAILQQLYPNPISDKAKFTILVPTNDVSMAVGNLAINTVGWLVWCSVSLEVPTAAYAHKHSLGCCSRCKM